jgi:hypothetical protein
MQIFVPWVSEAKTPLNIYGRRCLVPGNEAPRSLAARKSAELALVRVVHHYGGRPEFVLLGGLVPSILCAQSGMRHAGTTDVDVQVDLEISSGAVSAVRLEQALRKAEFTPDTGTIWRWQSLSGPQAVIKFELLADLEGHPAETVIKFDGCADLGAVNLRGTGFAARDIEVRTLTATDGEVRRQVTLNVAGLSGFLLAKAAAARSRRKPKDWYDIAFVLLHNDHGDPVAAALRARKNFGQALQSLGSTIADLRANFDGRHAQGTEAYVDQLSLDHPEVDSGTAAADCQLAVMSFCDMLLEDGASR